MRNITLFGIALIMAGLFAGCATSAPGEAGLLTHKTVDEDSSLPYVELNDSKFHVRTFGNPDHPVILFQHGGPGSDSRHLMELRKELDDGYRLEDHYFLVFWDQRGSGLSRRHDKDLINVDQYLADFKAMIKHYSPDRKAILYGHSWGGMYNALLINNYPELASAVIFSEPGPLSRELGNLVVHSSNRNGLTSEMVSDFFYSQEFLTPTDHNTLDYLMKVITLEPQPHRQVDGTRYNPIWRHGGWVMNWLDVKTLSWKEFDFTTNLGEYNKKVLFLGTEGSEDIGYDYQNTYNSRVFTNKEVREITGAGHSSMYFDENVSQAINYIRNYLVEMEKEGAL